MTETSEKLAFDEAKKRGLTGKDLKPYRQAMSLASRRQAEKRRSEENFYMTENRALRHALYELTAYSLTARTLHREWLVELAERVNNALITLGEGDRAIVPIEPIEGNGASMQLILKKAVPIGCIKGEDIIL